MPEFSGPQPRNGHGLARREVAALSVYFFLFFAAIAFPMPFAPILLRNRGLSLSEIAVLSSIYAVAGGLTQARVGHVSDSIGSRKALAAVSCVSLGLSYVFYDFAHSFWQFVPLYAWSGVSFLGGYTLPQAIISDWTSAAGSTARGFAVTRIWGTIGFIVSLVIVTQFPRIASGTGFLYWGAVLFCAAAVPVMIVREAPVTRTAHSMLRGALHVLASQRAYVFLSCYTLFRLCESGVQGYLGIYLRVLGGTNSTVAAAYMIAAIAETPLVLSSGHISDRVGRKGPLVLAFVVWALRLYMYSLITIPASVYYIQLLHGFTYGIVLVVSVAYMADIAPGDLRGTAQGLLSVTNAFAMAAGPLLVGFVGDALGLAAAFRVMAGVVVFATVSLALFLREPVRKERAETA